MFYFTIHRKIRKSIRGYYFMKSGGYTRYGRHNINRKQDASLIFINPALKYPIVNIPAIPGNYFMNSPARNLCRNICRGNIRIPS